MFHLPGACSKAEVIGGQGAYRADVGGVAREDGIKTGFREGGNLKRPSAVVKTDHGVVSHLFFKADTACALDAALAVQADQLAQGIVFLGMAFLVQQKAAVRGTEFHGLVLQRTFTALVADWAI